MYGRRSDSRRPPAHARGPVLLELVGPPGSGKSTVFEELLRRGDEIQPMPSLKRGRPYAASLARDVVGVVATLVRRRALGRHCTRRQVLFMAYLSTLLRILDGRHRPSAEVVVFDQGPIFYLTRSRMLDARLAPWWNRRFEAWEARMDAVVWLDAPDQVLVDRIDAREKAHRIKGRPADVRAAFVNASRDTLQKAIARLAPGERSPAILRFDTSCQSAREIADDVLAHLRVTPKPVTISGTTAADPSGADPARVPRSADSRCAGS